MDEMTDEDKAKMAEIMTDAEVDKFEQECIELLNDPAVKEELKKIAELLKYRPNPNRIKPRGNKKPWMKKR